MRALDHTGLLRMIWITVGLCSAAAASAACYLDQSIRCCTLNDAVKCYGPCAAGQSDCCDLIYAGDENNPWVNRALAVAPTSLGKQGAIALPNRVCYLRKYTCLAGACVPNSGYTDPFSEVCHPTATDPNSANCPTGGEGGGGGSGD